MADYRLIISNDADRDLDRIYIDGIIRWGEEQADVYYSGIIERFDAICENPFLYRAVNEIREGYRRSVYGSHSIYYRINGSSVEIMALIKYENFGQDQ